MPFDSNGNAGPTVPGFNGRVVGGWAQQPGGTVVYELIEDLGAEAESAVAAEAERLAGCLAVSVGTPR